MSSKQNFRVAHDHPKVVQMDHILNHFGQNLYTEIMDSKCILEVFMNQIKIAQNNTFLIVLEIFWTHFVDKKNVFFFWFCWL